MEFGDIKMRILANGCFDLFHDGHKYILSTALEWAERDEVLILLNSDTSIRELKGESRPINKEDQRRHQITMWIKDMYPLSKVTISTFSTEEQLSEMIDEFGPDIILKGNDRPDTRDIVGSDKWPVCIIPRLHKDGKDISTSDLLK